MTPKAWRPAALAALVGAAAVIGVLLLDPKALLLGYLTVAVTVSAIPAGSLGVLLMSYLVRGPWTQGLHAPLTAAALTAPLAGMLFIPVLAGLPWIYPWAQHAVGEPGSMKTLYLAPLPFIIRTVLYFAIWSALALWARWAWPDRPRMTVAASAGLIVYALTGSLAGIDWLESLTSEFHSSIYGLLFLTFQVLAGFAFVLVIALRPPDAPVHRYGAILFAALLLWAYNHAMQYIIIWSGNIPDEVEWYAQRLREAWGFALWGLIILQFVLPFFAMLADDVRHARRPLLAIAAATLALRLLEAVVLALPGTDANMWVALLGVLASLLVLGGIWWIGFSVVLERISRGAADDTRDASSPTRHRAHAR